MQYSDRRHISGKDCFIDSRSSFDSICVGVLQEQISSSSREWRDLSISRISVEGRFSRSEILFTGRTIGAHDTSEGETGGGGDFKLQIWILKESTQSRLEKFLHVVFGFSRLRKWNICRFIEAGTLTNMAKHGGRVFEANTSPVHQEKNKVCLVYRTEVFYLCCWDWVILLGTIFQLRSQFQLSYHSKHYNKSSKLKYHISNTLEQWFPTFFVQGPFVCWRAWVGATKSNLFKFPSHPLPSNSNGSGERCKLPQRGLGRNPSRQRILEHSMAKSDHFEMLWEIFQRSK